MTFTLRFDTDSAAFGEHDDERRAEIARVLRETADRVERLGEHIDSFRTVTDRNGNDIGRFALKPAGSGTGWPR